MRSSHSNSAHPPASILLVDDNHDGILARRSILEELGYRVVTANSGVDALKRVSEQLFDLVVTDYKMSPIDGLELIGELRKRGLSIPIILLSGFAETIGLSPASTGADVVVQKSSNEVAALVRSAKRLLSLPKKPAGSQRIKSEKTRLRGE
jgi:CheY-like chemotaxis protein